jgi:hypothetical protein
MTDPPRRPRVVEVARKPPAELRSIRVVVEADPDPDVAFLDQEELADRRDAYRRGEFSFIGLRIEAEVLIAGTTQVLESPGLWGIESDTDEDSLTQIAEEEWAVIRAVLKTIGVPTSELPLEMDREWIEWRK